MTSSEARTAFEEMGQRRRLAARVSVVSNTGLVLGKLSVGLLMSSVAVLSEAIHSGIDLLAAIIAVYAVTRSAQPADEDHAYGHGKFEDLSGTVEAALILVAAAVIIYEAARRLLQGGEVEAPALGVAVMAVSVVVYRVARETNSVALEADALHLSTDVWTSVGVMVAMAAIWATGWHWLDPVVAIGVAGLIVVAAFKLTRRTLGDLVDAPLPEEDRAVIVEVLAEHEGMHLGFDSLRTRRSGPERHIDLHLHFPPSMPLHEAHDLSHHGQLEIEQRLPHSHVLIHLEPCQEPCERCTREPCRDRTGTPPELPGTPIGEPDDDASH